MSKTLAISGTPTIIPSMIIGEPIVNGTPNDVLFVDGSGNLGQSNDFIYDISDGVFDVRFSTGNNSRIHLDDGNRGFEVDLGSVPIIVSSISDQFTQIASPVTGNYAIVLNDDLGISQLYTPSFQLTLSETNQNLVYSKGSDVYLSLDIATPLFEMGDISSTIDGLKLSIEPGNAVSVKYGGTNRLLNISPSTGIYAVGDFDNFNQGLFSQVDDNNKVFTLQKATDIWFSTDIANATGFWGNPGGNNTSIQWTDGTPKISLLAASAGSEITYHADFSTFWDNSGTTQVGLVQTFGGINVQWGDIQVAANKTYFILDDGGKSIALQSTGTVAMGDQFGYANATQIYINDPFQTITLTAANGVGIGGTPNSVSLLDVQSTTKGVKFPSMTTTQRQAITTTNIAGLVVYDVTLDGLFCTNNAGNWVQL